MFNKKIFKVVFISSIVAASTIATLAVLDMTGVINLVSKDTFNVEFRNYDNSYLWDQDFLYGQEVIYDGPKPKKVVDDGFDYTFSSWSKNLTAINEETIVYAQYTKNLQKLDVTFVNYDYSILYTAKVQYGGTAVYVGAAPERETDGDYVYTFSGWDKSLVNIRENTTFVAEFDKKNADKVVTFKNYDGNVLYKDAVEFGGNATYRGLEPVKPKDEYYKYEFEYWDHSLTNVTQNFTTTALFTAIPLEFDVTFLNYDETILYVDRVEKGGVAQFIGTTPYRESTEPGYFYVFTGWNKELTDIQCDTTVTAEFEKKQEELTITFRNYDETILDTQTCEYGGRVHYSKQPPEREPDQMYVYTFVGWDRNIDYVTESISVYPIYEKELRKYECKFVNEYGYVLYTTETTYGSPVYYVGETPYKQGDYFTKWKFVGWDNDVNCVVEDTVFTAQFEKNDEGGGGNEELFTVLFADYDGNVVDGDLVQKGEMAVCHLDEFNFNSHYFEEFNTYLQFVGFEYGYYSSWNKEAYVSDIQNNQLIFALYEGYDYSLVTYVGIDGEILYQEIVNNGDRCSYNGPQRIYLEPENGFLGWDQDTSYVWRSMIVRPILQKE